MKFLFYTILATIAFVTVNLLPSQMSDREKQQAILDQIHLNRIKQEENELQRALELSRGNARREGEYKINHAQRHADADLKQALAASQRLEDYNQRLVDSASMGNIEDVQKYLALGAHINALVKEDEDGHACTALIEAAEGGHKDIVQLLLENKADTNLKTPCCGTTALFEAASHNHTGIVRTLCVYGARVNDTMDGHTPLEVAQASDYQNTVATLLEFGGTIPAHNTDQIHTPRAGNATTHRVKPAKPAKPAKPSNGPGAATPAKRQAKEECVVCMESVAQSNFRILPCAHKLCKTCHPRIERNREGQRLCPTCRQPF